MKTTTKLIVHAAVRHLSAGVTHHLERLGIAGARVCAQQEFKRHRGWKLWRTTKTAVRRVVIPDNAGVSSIQQLRLDRIIGAAAHTQTLQLIHERRARLANVVLPVAIRLSDTDQNSWKSGHDVTILRRKVRAAIKRNRIRR